MNHLLQQQLIDVAYIIAVALFVLALKWLSSPATAKHGVLAGEFGAVLAVTATLCDYQIIEYKWIIVALAVGAIVGIPLGLVPMTAVPQRTALSHAFGALAAAMIGTAEYYVRVPHLTKFEIVEIAMEVIIGSLTFTGSLIAAGKLQEVLPQRPITYRGQNIVSLSVLGAAILIALWLMFHPAVHAPFPSDGGGVTDFRRDAGDPHWRR